MRLAAFCRPARRMALFSARSFCARSPFHLARLRRDRQEADALTNPVCGCGGLELGQLCWVHDVCSQVSHLELRFCQTSVYTGPWRSHAMTKHQWRLFISDQLRLQMSCAISSSYPHVCAHPRDPEFDSRAHYRSSAFLRVTRDVSNSFFYQRQSTRGSPTLSKLRQSSSVICLIYARSLRTYRD